MKAPAVLVPLYSTCAVSPITSQLIAISTGAHKAAKGVAAVVGTAISINGTLVDICVEDMKIMTASLIFDLLNSSQTIG